MATKVSQDVRQVLASTGVALGSVWGGPQKQRYFTPSGAEVWAIPSLREWSRKDSTGKVVAHGTRDANLDKGWLLSPPAELKPYCAGCDRWHDSEEDVMACVARKRDAAEAWEKKARQMRQKNGGGDSGEVATLTTEVAELKDLVKQLLEREVARG